MEIIRVRCLFGAPLASSQALPALKVAIDDDCLGKGLAFAKNNPPDFGLLFLAQFARFSIRTETEVTVQPGAVKLVL